LKKFAPFSQGLMSDAIYICQNETNSFCNHCYNFNSIQTFKPPNNIFVKTNLKTQNQPPQGNTIGALTHTGNQYKPANRQ
jgi:hypothetical protein